MRVHEGLPVRLLLEILPHLVLLCGIFAQPSTLQPFPKFVVVRTTFDLVNAVDVGAQHILVIKHLDLTKVEAQALDSTDYDFIGQQAALLPIKNTTLSLRGHCVDELDIPLPEGSASAIVRRPGQCYMIFDEGPVLFTDYVTGQLWIHNIYFRRNGGARDIESIIQTRLRGFESNTTISSELYLSDVTLQGDGTTESSTVGLVAAANLYMEGCSFSDLPVFSIELSPSISYPFSSRKIYMSCVDCAFYSLTADTVSVSAPVITYIRLENTSVIGSDIFLVQNPFPMLGGEGPYVFTDDPEAIDFRDAYAFNDYGEPFNVTGEVEPIYESDELPFLRPTDAWVSAVRKESCLGTFRSASGGSEPIRATCPNIPGYDVLPGSAVSAERVEEATDEAVIGGALAGGVAVLIVTGVMMLMFHRRQRMRNEATRTAKQIAATGTGAVFHLAAGHHEGSGSTVFAADAPNRGAMPAAAALLKKPTSFASQPQQACEAASDATRKPHGTEVQSITAEGSRRHIYQMPRPLRQNGSGIQTMQPFGGSGEIVTHPSQSVHRAQLAEGAGTADTHRSSRALSTRLVPLLTASCTTDSLRIMSTRKTASVADQVDKLEDALDATRRAGMLLCGRYEVLSSTARRVGGQGCVQFVFDREQRVECAVKFFFARRHFDHERALYGDASLRSAMAATREICANDDGAIIAANGARFPPFIILERGESLDEFQRLVQARTLTAGSADSGDIVTAAQTIIHTATRVEALHNLGWVHRDLKPSNVLRVPHLHTWALIDFGSTARIGEEARVEFTPAYAAPEVIRAYTDGSSTIVARPAMDVWSLGLIALEVLTGAPPFPRQTTRDEMFAMLLGRELLPWEGADNDAAVAERVAKLQAFKRGVLECLDRDPQQRPPVNYIVSSWRHVFVAAASTAHHTRVVASSRTM